MFSNVSELLYHFVVGGRDLLGQNQRETQTEEGNYALSYFRLYQVSFVYKCSKNQENETFLPKKSGETRPDEGGG